MLDFRVQGDNVRGMETLVAFQPLFTAGIFLFSCLSFLVVFIALLLAGFNMILNAKIGPLKEKLSQHDIELKELKAGQASLGKKMDQLLAQKS